MVFWSILFRFGHFFRVVSLPVSQCFAKVLCHILRLLLQCHLFSRILFLIPVSSCYQLLLACGMYAHFYLESSFIVVFSYCFYRFLYPFCLVVDLAA